METGHVVRFASQKHPFLVEAAPCLDLDCPCSIVTLKLIEVLPPGSPLHELMTCTMRVCLQTWIEHDPPPRSLEAESLVREFLARFPDKRIRELAKEFEQARAAQRRLESFSLSGPRDELVTYSNVIDQRGGVREKVWQHAFFFAFEGREFLVEDHYCANPDCDCRLVHLEFWERVHKFRPERHVIIEQRLMASFTLAGELKDTRFSEESASTTKHLLRAWMHRCCNHFQECQRRYDLIQAIGRRSFPPQPKRRIDPVPKENASPDRRPAESPRSVRRNDRCPCGSGLKFKRCCGRRAAMVD